MASRKPGNHIFQVSKFHVVDPVTDDWVEVIGAHQLRNQCQVYAFQPHSTKYTESQGHIPPASKPRGVYATSAMSGYHSPASAHHRGDYGSAGYGTAYPAATTTTTTPAFPQATQVAGVPHMQENASHDEKVRVLFDATDANSNRVVEPEELKRLMHMLHIDFSALTVEDLFRKADHDKDNVINFPEWQRFAELYPTLFDSLYYRLKAYYDHMAGEAQIDAARHLRGQFEVRSFVSFCFAHNS